MRPINKKGISLGSLSAVVLTFLVIVIVASVGGDVLTELQSTQTTDGNAFNITGNGLTGFTNLSNRFGLLGTIIIISVVISVIVGAFAFGKGGGI